MTPTEALFKKMYDVLSDSSDDGTTPEETIGALANAVAMMMLMQNDPPDALHEFLHLVERCMERQFEVRKNHMPTVN